MKKGKKLVHLIVPARTVRLAVLEKLLNTQEKNQNSSTAKLLTFSS